MTIAERLKKNISILLVEDDDLLREVVLNFLKKKCDTFYWASNGKEGLERFLRHSPDVVVTDIKMPEMDGLEMSEKIKTHSPNTPIVIITAFSQVSYLIKAIEIGVDRFVQKPFNRKDFLAAITHCALPIIQQKEIKGLNRKIEETLVQTVGSSPAVKSMISLIHQLASSQFSLVLYGETGVGKSFLARIIHKLSRRSDGPFVSVDIGAIPESLVESELFGHKKGAFTGADTERTGFFEMARGGTIFLDDLEDLSLYMQSKLLLVVDEKKVFPLGGRTPVEVDVRIIAATNKDLQKEVKAGRFREDLFYRLNDFSIRIPPLRERVSDISMLVAGFIAEAAEDLDKPGYVISPGGLELLKKHPWPGNIRELKSVMRRAVLFAHRNEITADDILLAMSGRQGGADCPVPDTPAVPLPMDELEDWAIRRALRLAGGKKKKAADLLGIGYSTLKRKMARYGIENRII